jgi:hypothetical protein
MATGRSNMLIKQIGEYLVACELARRGLVVATFSGNVPDFDIIATDFKGSSCPIQVKTIRGGLGNFQSTSSLISDLMEVSNLSEIGNP